MRLDVVREVCGREQIAPALLCERDCAAKLARFPSLDFSAAN
jgi:hypothetical protein